LRRIASAKRISLYETDPLTGERRALRTKAEIVDKLARNLSLWDVVRLAKRYKIRYSDVVKELEEFRRELFEEAPRSRSEEDILEDIYEEEKEEVEELAEVERVLRAIEEFKPSRPIRREKELQARLASWLASRFGADAVVEEYPFEHGQVDIVVWDSIAIELKIAKGKQSLKDLMGEVDTDKMYFSTVIAVIFDVGKDVGLDFFVNMIRSKGAKAVVIPVQIRRGKNRRQEIIIKQGARRIIIR
ncbi:putative nuclease RecB family, partial [Thermococcus prieurii virus 1]